MNVQRLNGLLGLAVRARQAAVGTDACRILIRSGECGILLLDTAAGPNTRSKAEQMCGRNGIPMRFLPEGMIGRATGKNAMVMAIRKGSFSEQVETDTRETGSVNG